MSNITNAEYANWVSRMNALRTKHGLTEIGCVAPGQGVVATDDKMNELLSNMSMASKWLSSSLPDRVVNGNIILESLQTTINNTLAAWEAVCVHNSVFSANHTSDRAHNREFSDNADYGGYYSNRSSNDSAFFNHCVDCSSNNSGDWSWCSGDANWTCGSDNSDKNYDVDMAAFNGDDNDDSSNWSGDNSFDTNNGANYTNKAVT